MGVSHTSAQLSINKLQVKPLFCKTLHATNILCIIFSKMFYWFEEHREKVKYSLSSFLSTISYPTRAHGIIVKFTILGLHVGGLTIRTICACKA